MAANNKNQKSVDRIMHPIMGGKVGIRDLMTDEGLRGYIDFGPYDYITKQALAGVTPSSTILVLTLDTTSSDLYTLSGPELAVINTYTRYPNFVAIVTGSGQQFFDIFPIYTGIVGAFTEIKVQLHADGAGNNAESTVVQFS